MYDNTGRPNVTRWQKGIAAQVAHRLFMSGITPEYGDFLAFIRIESLSPESISPERFAAMCVQIPSILEQERL